MTKRRGGFAAVALLAIGIAAGATPAGAEGAEGADRPGGAETAEFAVSELPACHRMPADDGKPFRVAAAPPADEASGARSGETSESALLPGIRLAAYASAGVAVAALAAGWLTFRFRRLK